MVALITRYDVHFPQGADALMEYVRDGFTAFDMVDAHLCLKKTQTIGPQNHLCLETNAIAP